MQTHGRRKQNTARIKYCDTWSTKFAALTTSVILASLASPSFADTASTQTPIKHVVVVFFENISFDHYFATYPFATNPPGEPRFVSRDATPSADTLLAAGLLTNNPNLKQPYRLDNPSQV